MENPGLYIKGLGDHNFQKGLIAQTIKLGPKMPKLRWPMSCLAPATRGDLPLVDGPRHRRALPSLSPLTDSTGIHRRPPASPDPPSPNRSIYPWTSATIVQKLCPATCMNSSGLSWTPHLPSGSGSSQLAA